MNLESWSLRTSSFFTFFWFFLLAPCTKKALYLKKSDFLLFLIILDKKRGENGENEGVNGGICVYFYVGLWM